MRVIKLTMSAFGPYAGECMLELDKLGKSGIYLITGDTGAGKTTIFDAVSYALFDKVSGNNRDNTMLRSKYATPDTPTKVILEFEYAEKKYRVERNPSYERPKTRGEGTTVEKASALLVYPDGRTVSGQSEVNEAVRNIIGIDREQFLRIAMIAQGDFLKLLFAPTKERQDIFRKIFGTQKYDRLQECLKAELSKINAKMEQLNTSMCQYILGAGCDANNEKATELERAKSGEMPVDEVCTLIETLIAEDEKLLSVQREEISQLEESISIADKQLVLAAQKEKLFEDIGLCEKKLDEAQNAVTQLEKRRTEAEAKRPHIEKLNETISVLNGKLSDYDTLEGVKNETVLAAERLAGVEPKLEKSMASYDERVKALSDIKRELEELTVDENTLANLQVKRTVLMKDAELLASLDKKLKEEADVLNELEDAQEKYKNLQMQYEESVRVCEEKRHIYLSAQAGILAKSLKEGCPCPVCGSTTHPHPAILSDTIPDKTDVEKARLDSEKKRENAEKASKCAGELLGIYNSKKSENQSLLDTFGITSECDAVMMTNQRRELILKELEELNHCIEAENEKSAKKSRLQKMLNTTNEAMMLESETLSKLKSEKSALEAVLKEKQAILETYISSLDYGGKQEALEAIRAKTDESRRLLQDIENVTKECEEKKTEQSRLGGELAGLRTQFNALCEINALEEREKKSQLVNKKQKLGEEEHKVSERVSQNKSALFGLSGKRNEMIELEREWIMLSSLSNTANGNISGKDKIKLETFVQMDYFDRIIHKANVRFMTMSSGQYELVRRKESTNLQSQSGLELDVIDHYNGSTRSVKTLSGGEAFIASLSLALGLSDEIQGNSGGVKLDTMFIDEGFGSLDEEALRQAVRALDELGNGNRLVGIISHVAELKERIDKQIVVTKEKSGGSVARIVMP